MKFGDFALWTFGNQKSGIWYGLHSKFEETGRNLDFKNLKLGFGLGFNLHNCENLWKVFLWKNKWRNRQNLTSVESQDFIKKACGESFPWGINCQKGMDKYDFVEIIFWATNWVMLTCQVILKWLDFEIRHWNLSKMQSGNKLKLWLQSILTQLCIQWWVGRYAKQV